MKLFNGFDFEENIHNNTESDSIVCLCNANTNIYSQPYAGFCLLKGTNEESNSEYEY